MVNHRRLDALNGQGGFSLTQANDPATGQGAKVARLQFQRSRDIRQRRFVLLPQKMDDFCQTN